MSNLSTAATVLSSDHGRMRRAQRLIDKHDLQSALRYGTREPNYNQRGELCWKYTYRDIVYITDQTCRREITSWAIPGAGLDVEKRQISAKMQSMHKEAARRILYDKSSWTSHTVVVVDQSGSMRKTDVEGGATRSDAVWLTIAVDFVARQIEAKQVNNSNVVSVVVMGIDSAVLVDRKPHDWLLFNGIIDLLRKQEPHFDGNYLPALDAAENLLLSNTFGSCELSLIFLSDGKPSDRLPRGTHSYNRGNTIGAQVSQMGSRIDSLASRFGRRLSVTTVGFAGPAEDFSVLQNLAERPAQFGSRGRFIPASLNAEALGTAFDSAISSSLRTRSELTAIGGSSQRAVRDVRRQARDTVGQDDGLNDNWYSYLGIEAAMKRGKAEFTWEGGRRVFNVKTRQFVHAPPLNSSAKGIALHSAFFGEGAERLVREFREVDLHGSFVGPKLVAKESRFQMDVANTSRRDIMSFHRSFCETQNRAQRLAQVFNQRLANLPGYNPRTTPGISFLECSVYIVDDRNLGEMGVLVEKQLDPSRYKKWNNNCGGVDGQDEGEYSLGGNVNRDEPLGAIAESDEEEDTDDSEEEDTDEDDDGECDVCIRVEEIPQAFSHFTYRYTRRRLLVCDLQGVLSDRSSPPQFELTDPVIHFKSRRGKRRMFGRTDRGRKGIDDFFRTHECGPLCRMINRRWVRRFGAQQRSSHLDGLEEAVSNLRL